MPARFAYDTDPFADTFTEEATSPAPTGDRPGTAPPSPSATWPATAPAPHAAPAAMMPVAAALWTAGFVRAAREAARLAGDARGEEWSAIATADAALATAIAAQGAIGIPSVQVREDGAPRFVVCGDDADALRAALADEHGERGVDAELRLFLDEALRPGDRYVDAHPGAGFATLTAATREGVAVLAIVDDAATGEAIRRSARVSGCEAGVTVRGIGDPRALDLPAHGGLTVLHAGHAGNVALLLQALRARTGTVPVDAVAWRCGAARDADYDAEALQVAAAVLGVLGFRHFALATGEDGIALVPAEAMASNTMIFSLADAFLARAGD